jgi:hypothetical protein
VVSIPAIVPALPGAEYETNPVPEKSELNATFTVFASMSLKVHEYVYGTLIICVVKIDELPRLSIPVIFTLLIHGDNEILAFRLFHHEYVVPFKIIALIPFASDHVTFKIIDDHVTYPDQLRIEITGPRWSNITIEASVEPVFVIHCVPNKL